MFAPRSWAARADRRCLRRDTESPDRQPERTRPEEDNAMYTRPERAKKNAEDSEGHERLASYVLGRFGRKRTCFVSPEWL